jgi:hypothetical protein
MGKGNARRAKRDGKMAFYKRMRKKHPGARDVDIKSQWDERVAKAVVAKKAADDKAKYDADQKALKAVEKAARAKLCEEVAVKSLKAKEAKAKADKEAAELAKLVAEDKPVTPEAPAVTA